MTIFCNLQLHIDLTLIIAIFNLINSLTQILKLFLRSLVGFLRAQDLGYYEDYDSCYFDYRKAHRAQKDWPSVPNWEEPIRKFIDRPLELFYGYGTKPFYTLFVCV